MVTRILDVAALERLIDERAEQVARRILAQHGAPADGVFCSRGPLPAGTSKKTFSRRIRTGEVKGWVTGDGPRTRVYYCRVADWAKAGAKPIAPKLRAVPDDDERAATELLAAAGIRSTRDAA